MSVVRKAFVYSLFIVSSVDFSLHSQESGNKYDNQGDIVIYDSGSDEIYPLADVDRICLISEIQTYIDGLDFAEIQIIENDLTQIRTNNDDCMIALIDITEDNNIQDQNICVEPHSLLLPNNLEIITMQDDTIIDAEDDDIIPVPHDLINSVKKATKKQKKLEKLEKKAKAKSSKKSKNKNKKS